MKELELAEVKEYVEVVEYQVSSNKIFKIRYEMVNSFKIREETNEYIMWAVWVDTKRELNGMLSQQTVLFASAKMLYRLNNHYCKN